ncbi:hypothetical protein GCM10026986_15750 [Nitrincola alkalisediminis]
MKIQVVHLQGNTLTFGRALGREVLRNTLVLFTYFLALFTQNKQTLHDYLVKTVVVNKSSNRGSIPSIDPIPDPIPAPPNIPDEPSEIPKPSHNAWVISGFCNSGDAVRFSVSQQELEAGIVLGGRKTEDTTHIVPDNTVSGRHLRLRLQLDTGSTSLILEDLDSMNGTLVDEQRLQPHHPKRISLQSRIQIGGSEIQVSRG